jgi:hypothetical protein
MKRVEQDSLVLQRVKRVDVTMAVWAIVTMHQWEQHQRFQQQLHKE